jgi:uncharacterized protein
MRQILILIVSLLILFGVHAQSLLYEISGNSLKKTSYLYGTMHIRSKQQLPIYEKAKEKLTTCNLYVMELDPSKMNSPSLLAKLLIPDNKSLKDYLSEKDYDTLSVKFNKITGFQLMMFEKFQPIMIESILEIMETKNKTDSSDVMMMDMELSSLAAKNSITTKGIETPMEQVDAMLRIPIEDQIKMLLAGLKDSSQNTEDLYAKNDIDTLYLSTVSGMTTSAQTALITDRNINMANRIDLLMKKQSIFIAVGAAHLGGEEGLVNLLKRKGYTLKEIH